MKKKVVSGICWGFYNPINIIEIYGDYFITCDNDPGYPNMVGDGETGLDMFGHMFFLHFCTTFKDYLGGTDVSSIFFLGGGIHILVAFIFGNNPLRGLRSRICFCE